MSFIYYESQVCNQASENCFHRISRLGGFCLLSAMFVYLFVCLCVCTIAKLPLPEVYKVLVKGCSVLAGQCRLLK